MGSQIVGHDLAAKPQSETNEEAYGNFILAWNSVATVNVFSNWAIWHAVSSLFLSDINCTRSHISCLNNFKQLIIYKLYKLLI